jgi:hypothetical protein
MKIDYQIIPECYVETNFIETLVPPSPDSGYNHQKSCYKVESTMKGKFNDFFALGIIDKDKKAIRYLDEFEPINKRENLFLYKHKTKHHYFIQISPAIEKFILIEATEVNVNLEEFGLSNDLEMLKRVTKKTTSKKEPRLSLLFTELVQKKAPQVVTLSNWIGYLKENTYQSNIELLKNL